MPCESNLILGYLEQVVLLLWDSKGLLLVSLVVVLAGGLAGVEFDARLRRLDLDASHLGELAHEQVD